VGVCGGCVGGNGGDQWVIWQNKVGVVGEGGGVWRRCVGNGGEGCLCPMVEGVCVEGGRWEWWVGCVGGK